MAPIKVYGAAVSTATQRVLVALHEKDLEFEMVNIDLKAGEHKKDSFLAINPFGQVPAFEHGDLKLFESRAITQCIAHEYQDKGTQLLSPGKEMAILGVWMEVEAHQYDPLASKLCYEQVYKKFFGLQTDPTVVEEHEGKLSKVLDVYETRLSQSKYLAANHFTLADLHHLPTLQLLIGTPTKKLFDSRPHVCAWVKDILARPAWAKVLAMKGH